MKTTCCKIFRLIVLGLLLFAVSVGRPETAAAQPRRVAVLPFKINAEKDLSFLRDGIVDMLASRLAWEDKVVVLSREETARVLKTDAAAITEGSAREIGTRLGVDYVLFGSLTVFGNSVSIDAKMVDVSGSKPPLTFFNQSQQMDQVISDINLFATDINEKIFGRAMPARQAHSQIQTPPGQSDLRAHPEKMLANGFGEMDEEQPKRVSPGSAFMATQEASGRSAQFWKSQNIKQQIVGIAIGDVDRDGKQETVLVTPYSVEIYRFEQQRFYKVNTVAERRLGHIIGVDVADINGNGYPEIFVTSLNPYRKFIKSFVLEFNGQAYTEIVKDREWYFRVVEHPSRGKILLGQRHKTSSPLSGEIYEMEWKNSEYEPAVKVFPANLANVLGFAFGNAMNDGGEVAVTFDAEDYLRVYDLTGKEIWKDGEHSGGTLQHFEQLGQSPEDMKDKAYYPVRTCLFDINRDGKNEVITAHNQRLSELLSYRKFSGGEIEIRTWDGIGLAAHFKTRKLSGFFSDFAVGDFDSDGKNELVAALVIAPGDDVVTPPKSAVISFKLE